MIRIMLSPEEKQELEQFRGQASSKKSEKALMLLMNAEGLSAKKIGKRIKRNAHTVRTWLKRYKTAGLEGLQSKASPGCPKEKRDKCKQVLEEILPLCPQELGYQDLAWSVPLIQYHLETTCGLKTSEDTIQRALSDLGYSYKRPSKSVSPAAPSAEEKRAEINKIIEDIQEVMSKKPTEIFALDESHFSTEPYLIRGWFKKRWPPQDSKSAGKRKAHNIWLVKSKKRAFLLEAVQTG